MKRSDAEVEALLDRLEQKASRRDTIEEFQNVHATGTYMTFAEALRINLAVLPLQWPIRVGGIYAMAQPTAGNVELALALYRVARPDIIKRTMAPNQATGVLTDGVITFELVEVGDAKSMDVNQRYLLYFPIEKQIGPPNQYAIAWMGSDVTLQMAGGITATALHCGFQGPLATTMGLFPDIIHANQGLNVPVPVFILRSHAAMRRVGR
jgi:hypothetical protein